MAGEYKGSAGRVPVDSNGTSLADTTTSALKVVSVDSSGSTVARGWRTVASGTSTQTANGTVSLKIADVVLQNGENNVLMEIAISDVVAGTFANGALRFRPYMSAANLTEVVTASLQTSNDATPVTGRMYALELGSAYAWSTTSALFGAGVGYCPGYGGALYFVHDFTGTSWKLHYRILARSK